MLDRDIAPGTATPHQSVDRERAQLFSKALCVLLQRQDFYVPLTGTYLLPQLYERVRSVDGHGIHINTLRAYLRGETMPSDSKVRLLADALGVPRGVLLFAAGYLTPEDLPHYPTKYTTLATIEADIRELEALPLSIETKNRILHDLRTSARILHLLAADRAALYTASTDERELLIEELISLWEAPTPAPPPLTTNEEAPAAPPQPAAAPMPQPVAQPVRREVPSVRTQQAASITGRPFQPVQPRMPTRALVR